MTDIIFLPQMTPGEMKFALQVEMVLNRIPQPEYRQLMVEAMMVLVLIEQHDNGKTRWNEVISVDRLVHTANDIFLDEQVDSFASYVLSFEHYNQNTRKHSSKMRTDRRSNLHSRGGGGEE